MEKKEYVAPVVVVYGDVEEITKASSPTPTRLDANYNQGASGNIFS